MKLDVSPAQLEAIKRLAEDCESMIGGGNYEADKAWSRNVTLIRKMLLKNGHERESETEE